MIVCHCRHITDHDINTAIDWMRAADSKSVITPGKVYRALGKAAECGSCMPQLISVMRRNKNLEVPMNRTDREAKKKRENQHER